MSTRRNYSIDGHADHGEDPSRSRDTFIDPAAQDLKFRVSFSPSSSTVDLNEGFASPITHDEEHQWTGEDQECESSSCPEDDEQDSSPCHSEYSDEENSHLSDSSAKRNSSSGDIPHRPATSKAIASRDDSPTLPLNSPPILPASISASELALINRSAGSTKDRRRARIRPFEQYSEGALSRIQTGSVSVGSSRTYNHQQADGSDGELTEFSDGE
ncbi:hypothetical protein I203_101044 [Kwoniella mangroviensis CBS 8507]|uniref:uncharacterized protein n=1 Tax=Kwoniella mangroviensis CBS 8507 TaxID=1296122 RepID=UPI00080D4077|nr:uncharacterized protein I203_02681 [Kwoniella mangroviensis CBS 8507]OCF68022.1 hypothetical protein I203_02681 [Kwoniella mangroviensis CBS 8507]